MLWLCVEVDGGFRGERQHGQAANRRKNTVVACAILRIKQIYTQVFKSDF